MSTGSTHPTRRSRVGRVRIGRIPQFARELVLVAVAAAAYGGVRAVTEGSVDRAVANGEHLLGLERSVGLAWEDALQSAALTSDTLVALANWIYIWGHWPVIVVSAVVLYHTRRPSYTLLRNAVFVSAGIGFLFFGLFPVAPPRLIDAGLLDTVLERSESYRALQPPALTNQYAAFPSLHFGWNLLVGIVLFLTFSHLAVRIFAVAMPVAMALAVVASANHYVLDVGGGGAVVVVGLVVATVISGARSPVAAVAGRRRWPVTESSTLQDRGIERIGMSARPSSRDAPDRPAARSSGRPARRSASPCSSGVGGRVGEGSRRSS